MKIVLFCDIDFRKLFNDIIYMYIAIPKQLSTVEKRFIYIY